MTQLASNELHPTGISLCLFLTATSFLLNKDEYRPILGRSQNVADACVAAVNRADVG